MKLEELTEYLVKNLVQDKEAVLVEREDGDNGITITVLVSKEEIGAVIGRNGKIANAIRTIVQAAAYTTKAGFVKINIDTK
ncbi:MAG: KH domain-containing protein [Bacilli bacterium]|nr:KH domain-containing protein [Bacilli bacterium]